MRIFYLQKRELRSLLLALLLPVLCFSYSLGTQRAAAVLAEPYYQGSGAVNCLSLTVNVDWGEEYIPDMLQLFREKQVQVTFFVTGRWAKEHPELLAEMAAAGHEIGNHAYSHTSPNSLDVAGNKDEILRTEEAIREACGCTTLLYAPPSGEREPQVLQAAEELGYLTVLWSIDTIDWQKPQPEVIVQRVMSKLHPGAIILSHPTEQTLAALPQLIDNIQAEGYQFVTVAENLSL
ncbi:MAG: polysaccharide deacetylase family protein [Firmicutes bacterium]|nr:polysaccharide deacetylase family protein [Bacillota bacterium]